MSMLIQRQQYLEKLIKKQNNGRVKIITGLRRCGKSFLLFELYANYLREQGMEEDQLITLALDELPNARYRNPMELDKFVRERIRDPKKQYYVMIDEIQFVSEIQNPYVDDPKAKLGFIDVVLGLMKIRNADIYVTGSNSQMLSSDILTQFRDRGDEIRVNPLSFAEFFQVYDGDKRHAWRDYCTYGGMPLVLSMDSHEEKMNLRGVFKIIAIEGAHILGHVPVKPVFHLMRGATKMVGLLRAEDNLENTVLFRSSLNGIEPAGCGLRLLDGTAGLVEENAGIIVTDGFQKIAEVPGIGDRYGLPKTHEHIVRACRPDTLRPQIFCQAVCIQTVQRDAFFDMPAAGGAAGAVKLKPVIQGDRSIMGKIWSGHILSS